MRLLVVEDNESNRRLFEALLTAAGATFDCVEDGAQAVAAAERGGYDAILMRMPVMDGVEAARRIRAGEARQGRARTPIVAVTANAHSFEGADCREAGIDSVIRKPVDTRTFFAAVVAAVEEGAARGAAA